MAIDAALRRGLDVAAAATGLVLLGPLLLVTAAAVRLDSSGPIFYRAARVGRGGRVFRLHKFRSMVDGADRQGAAVTTAGDARVTRVGRLLRRTKLDELPQLLDVLVGDMSLVGPRPEDPRYVALYTPGQRALLAVRPGITSAASLAYRHEEELLSGDDWETVYCNQVLPDKLAIDLAYLERRTVWSDLALIARTIAAMAR